AHGYMLAPHSRLRGHALQFVARHTRRGQHASATTCMRSPKSFGHDKDFAPGYFRTPLAGAEWPTDCRFLNRIRVCPALANSVNALRDGGPVSARMRLGLHPRCAALRKTLG